VILLISSITKEIIMEELVLVENWLSLDESPLRTKAIENLANELGTTMNTVYRWLRSGDVFISEQEGAMIAYKMINFKEKA